MELAYRQTSLGHDASGQRFLQKPFRYRSKGKP
jgi:hypothetical protein